MNTDTFNDPRTGPLNPAQPEGGIRGIMGFPEINSFYALLMDRIYSVFENYLDKPFTIFINGLPRNHEPGTKLFVPRYGDFTLIYCGVLRQRELLERDLNKKSDKADKAWQGLHDTRRNKMDQPYSDNTLDTQKSIVGASLYQEFKSGGLGLDDIAGKGMGKLSGYFKGIITGGEAGNIQQQYEYDILNTYLNIQQYRYLTLPLIQFAEFDGLVYLIYHEDDHEKVLASPANLNIKLVGNWIKGISRQFEALVLNWDLVGGNEYRTISISDALEVSNYEAVYKNPILKELGFAEYYKKHEPYFKLRLELTSRIPINILEQHRRIALMSILIDSYTHNVSAHSLVALEGWLKQRALFLAGRQMDEVFSDIPLIKEQRHFVTEMYQLVRFLLDKGAFWTGLTRDQSFGGKTDNLYNVLWYDFINNPLYLGTIAYTEGILKLNINITVLKKNSVEEGVVFHKTVVADGTFATIDLQKMHELRESLENGQSPDLESVFVIPGTQFNNLKTHLTGFNTYFPGGVVGKHAFFTILENEIRNVKHYPEAVLKDMVKNGLTLNISIEEDEYPHQNPAQHDRSEYYKIGVWLKSPVKVTETMLGDRLHKLYGDIINDNYNPRLGGVYQDKVCAAMLFNNTFTSVQHTDKTSRHRIFYPWMKTGLAPSKKIVVGETFEELEITARRFLVTRPEFQESKDLFFQKFQEGEYYYKKLFHLWRGEDIFEYTHDNIDAEWENLARFRFVYVPQSEQQEDKIRRLREQGVVRIIGRPAKSVQEAYQIWLEDWLHEGNDTNLIFKVNTKPVAAIHLSDRVLRFNQNTISELPGAQNTRVIQLTHGKGSSTDAPNECRYRSHGILKQHFCQGKNIELSELSVELASELLETMATRVCIFDRRVAKWFDKIRIEKMQALAIEAYDESHEQWNAIRDNKPEGFLKYNFLVVHLSFLESFRDEKNNDQLYTEERIDRFIEEQILQDRQRPDNFILVITSGRGRQEWYRKLDNLAKNEENAQAAKNYTYFVTFRPVESLVGAVESALTKGDDIEMKYQVVKVLIGS